MTKKVLAFCTDASVFLQNKILDEKLAALYPGALWASRLAAKANLHGYEFMTGDLALEKIRLGTLSAPSVFVIQEEISQIGEDLLRLGAKPQSLFCFESPIFASRFYGQLPVLAQTFPHRILFRGAFHLVAAPGKNSTAYFPSFEAEQKPQDLSWNQKKFLVMVAGNKYFEEARPVFREILSRLKDVLLRRQRTRIDSEIVKTQLHDKRLEVIEHFGALGKIDLFGSNWENLGILPKRWQTRLGGILTRLKPQKCGDKKELISQYKFSVCLENLIYPGYVTEKMIDALHAGVIPLYLGAPDITDFVPASCFIDLRKYKNLKDLSDELLSFSEDRAKEMIHSGQEFLMSRQGLRFSYDGFADQLLEEALRFSVK